MIVRQELTTAQPTPTPASLRAEIKTKQVALDAALAQRTDIAARLEAAPGPGVRVPLRRELRGVDGQIGHLKAQLSSLQTRLGRLEAVPVKPAPQPTPLPAPLVAPTTLPPTATTTVPPITGFDHNALVLGGIVTVFVLAPLAFAIAWRLIRRPAPVARIDRMEEAIDAIASEVESVSESQRFLTNTLVPEAMKTPVREKLPIRR